MSSASLDAVRDAARELERARARLVKTMRDAREPRDGAPHSYETIAAAAGVSKEHARKLILNGGGS